MTPSQAIKLARKILEDDFVLQYFTDDHLRLMQRLEASILSPKGEVILLQGSPGCGITTLLRSLHTLHSAHTQILRGDIYIGYWDFVDHVCDAYNVRRGSYRKKTFPAQMLRTLSLTKRQVLLIDDLDVYIANEDELKEAFGTIRALSSKLPGFTFVVSTRDARLLARFLAYAQPNWCAYTVRQRITEGEYYNIAGRLWNGMNGRYSLGLSEEYLTPSKPYHSLDIQDVNRALRLQLVERFLHQQGALDALSNFNSFDEYESYVQSIITP